MSPPTKHLPCSEEELVNLCKQRETPFHLYDAQSIQNVCDSFTKGFEWTFGLGSSFINHYAVKALPNPVMIDFIHKRGKMGCDCSSMGELVLCEKLGITGEKIMFTSNNTSKAEYQKAYELGAIINLDDYGQIDVLKEALGGKMPELIGFRFNPGPERTGNLIIGEPVEAKYGLTRGQMVKAYMKCKELGVKRFGLHTMVASNSLCIDELTQTGHMLFTLALEIFEATGIKLEFVNLGGGVGVPYRPEQSPIDIVALGANIKSAYEKLISNSPLHPLNIKYECGRVVTGDCGWLVTRAINMKNTYKQYLGVDATMADLMRPGLYGAYHHITVVKDASGGINASTLPEDKNIFKSENYCDPGYSGKKTPLQFDVTGSLCENNDKFAIDRVLNCEPEIGDIVVIHTTGAHGIAMGFQYNCKLRPAEVLRVEKDKFVEIKRRETLDDFFTTYKFPTTECFKNSTEVAMKEGHGF